MQVAGTHFRTRSLYAAAFLLARGFPLADVGTDPQGRVEFSIGGDEGAVRECLREYRRGTAAVNAQRYGSELRRLKAILHGSE